METPRDASRTTLSVAVAIWLGFAIAGQWAFFAYIAAFYGPSLSSGDFESWNRLAALGVKPFRAGDNAGNLAFLIHALGAGVVAFGGALQLIPAVRQRWPRFHHWNGRVFLATVVLLSLTGFYLVWLRNTPPAHFTELATSVNGVLILAFAWLAWRRARSRELAAHRRWALRLYLVANAQWFTRIGVFAYFVLASLAGHKPSFSDPFFALWSFGCYLLPLAMLELYLRARNSARPHFRYALAASLVVLTLVMLAGSVAFGLFTRKLIAGSVSGF